MENIYRGKRFSDGEWIFGSLLVLKRYSSDIDHYFIIPNDPNWFIDPKFSGFEVDPDTVCQSIGMKDCKGTSIFEHDIIVSCGTIPVGGFLERDEDYEYTMRILPFSESGDFYAREPGIKSAIRYTQVRIDACEEVFAKNEYETWTVIGNMFDSPELFCSNGGK